MSDPYDFFATPKAGAPAPPPTSAPPVAPGNGFGTPSQPAQPYGAPAPGYGTPAPGYGSPTPGRGAPQQQFGSFGAVPPQAPGQAAYAGAPGYASPRPGTVVAAAVLVFIQAAFAMLAGIGMVLAGLAAKNASSQLEAEFSESGFTVNEDSSAFGGNLFESLGNAAIGIGFVVLVVGAVFVLFGVKILAGALWAAITVTVFQALALFSTVRAVMDADLFGTVLTGALPVAVLLCLWTGRARSWFGSR